MRQRWGRYRSWFAAISCSPAACLCPSLLHSTQYVCKRVSARVLSGLPDGAFTTDEQRSDGLLQHCWVWR